MVGPGEVDDELQPEVVDECGKYGEVVKVIIYEVSMIRYLFFSLSFILCTYFQISKKVSKEENPNTV